MRRSVVGLTVMATTTLALAAPLKPTATIDDSARIPVFGRVDLPHGLRSDFLQARLSASDHDIGLFLRGDVRVANDGRDILSVAPGGVFLVSSRSRVTGRLQRWLAFPSQAAQATSSFAIDGRAHPVDDAAREWLRETLTVVVPTISSSARPGRQIDGFQPPESTPTSGSVLIGERGRTADPGTGVRLCRFPSPAGQPLGSVGLFWRGPAGAQPHDPISSREISWLVGVIEQDEAPHVTVVEAVADRSGATQWFQDGSLLGAQAPDRFQSLLEAHH